MKKIKIFVFSLMLLFSTVAPCVACKEKATELIIKVPKLLTINSVPMPDIKDAKMFLTGMSEDFVFAYDKNVKISIVEFEEGEETRAITDTFGTENAADILYDSFFNMSSFIHTGNAIPLDGILTAEQTDDLYPQYYGNGMYDGKLYMMPYLSSQNILIYNKELMRACGLGEYIKGEYDEIGDWDIEDWTHILDTLASELPAGCVPMMMYAKDNRGDTHIMTLLRAFGSEIFNEQGEFDLEDDPYAVQAIEWIQDGVEKGWYMPVPYDKTMNDNSSKFAVDQLVFYNFYLGSSNYLKVVAEGGKDKYGFVNYPGNKCTTFCEGFEIFDNGDKRKISVAKDFIKFVYGSDKWMECAAGSIPASEKVAEKYRDKIFLLEAFSKNTVNVVDFNRNLPNWQGQSDSVRSVFYKEIAKLFVWDVNKEFVVSPEDCAKSLDKKLNDAINSGREKSTPHA